MNLAGLGLILFAILLFVAEIKVVSHGLLSLGGAIALVAGSLLLFSGKGDAAGTGSTSASSSRGSRSRSGSWVS